jgi:GTP-binding protein EngB required for normal cell division
VIGKHAGTTRRIRKYALLDDLILVDMPGYGRMKGFSKKLIDKKNAEIINFLEANAKSIVLAVHVLDISTFIEVTWRLEKKGFRSVDVEMIHLLSENLKELPLIVANKIDKGNRQEIEANLSAFKKDVSNGYYASIVNNVFPTSVKTGEGVDTLKNAILRRLASKGFQSPLKKF